MTNKVAIVTDTTACIPTEMVHRYGISLVPVEVVFGDKVYRDSIDITPAEFYALLRQAKKPPTTSGSSPAPFFEAYHEASQRADNILCITESSKLSAMFNSAQIAAQMAKTALPDVVIKVLECATAAAGQGLVVLAAARAADSGRSLSEVVNTANSVMYRVNLFATLDTLRYLVRSGRVPRAAGFVGSLLNIKPIFTITNGDAYPVTNTRTNHNAVKRILKIMEEKIVEGQPLHAVVMHADAPDRAKELRDQIRSRFDCDELFITEFTPVMGAHTGPGVIGVAFYSGD